jgi:hypothetical protein
MQDCCQVWKLNRKLGRISEQKYLGYQIGILTNPINRKGKKDKTRLSYQQVVVFGPNVWCSDFRMHWQCFKNSWRSTSHNVKRTKRLEKSWSVVIWHHLSTTQGWVPRILKSIIISWKIIFRCAREMRWEETYPSATFCKRIYVTLGWTLDGVRESQIWKTLNPYPSWRCKIKVT